MALLPAQQYWPLATAAVWWGLALYQVRRDRYRTWTERFFLASCVFVGGYAVADVLFFTAPSKDVAATWALVSFSVLTLGIACLFLFALVFYTRLRRAYFLIFVPTGALLVWLWTSLVSEMDPLPDYLGPPWTGVWNPVVFAVWVLACVIFSVLTAYYLVQTYREVAQHTSKLRRRMLGLLLSGLLALVLGSLTNVTRGFSGQTVLPLFSTGLILPGLVSFITLSPMSTERLSVAVRRWKASQYDIKAAFIIYTDGTLIGARIRPGEKVIDQDLFGATLDVIQNFMHTSFPSFRGSLSAIKLGEDTLVVERGRYAYLTVVLQGEENDQLRRHMRDMLLRYERDNQSVLSDWRGMPAEAIGTEALLGSLFEDIKQPPPPELAE